MQAETYSTKLMRIDQNWRKYACLQQGHSGLEIRAPRVSGRWPGVPAMQSIHGRSIFKTEG